jgi:hypothetical protein
MYRVDDEDLDDDGGLDFDLAHRARSLKHSRS